MHEHSNGERDRVERLDKTVERLTTEVASLKLELATLVSALREHQSQQAPKPPAVVRFHKKAEPPSQPSPAPAAVVVLLAIGFLSWQLITGPRSEEAAQAGGRGTSTSRLADVRATPPPPPTIDTATEPPVTPLVPPTVYKGTLSVAADRPGARVFVNRKEVGVAPVRVRNLRAGAHLVWIESEGFRRWTRVVTVPAERVTRVSADLEPIEPAIEH